MQRYCPTFHYIPVISRPEEEMVKWSGHTGYVQDLWDRGLVETAMGAKPTPDNTHVLLCGNPGMIEGMIERLGTEGFVEGTRQQTGQIMRRSTGNNICQFQRIIMARMGKARGGLFYCTGFN